MMSMMDLDEAIKEVEEVGSTERTVSPAAPPATYPKILTLNVGGRKFQTLKSTLRSESGLFRNQLSDRFSWEPQADGSYFLDANPNLFEHLLDFMRRPSVFPLFYTKAHGFDYNLYNRLEIEAEYFQMDTLHAWIKEKKYLRAIIINNWNPTIRAHDHPVVERTSGNESIDRYMLPRVRSVYICPRGIQFHRGDPARCGLACRRTRGDGPLEYAEEAYVNVVSAKDETLFNEAICRLE